MQTAIPKMDTLAIDSVIYKWFWRALTNMIPVSETLICKKALEVATNIKLDECKSSGI